MEYIKEQCVSPLVKEEDFWKIVDLIMEICTQINKTMDSDGECTIQRQNIQNTDVTELHY